MSSRDDNDLLTRVGPDTPMGALLRHYWIPVLRSGELTPAGQPKRVRLLGEDLLAFRSAEHLGTSDGAIIHVRRRLVTAAKALRDGSAPPPGLDPAADFVRSTSLVLPPEADWVEGAMQRVVRERRRHIQ